MLPEFIFTGTGNGSMQEFSRDDFSLLNGTAGHNGEKDMCSILQRINPSPVLALNEKAAVSVTEITSNSAFDTIKLGGVNAVDLFPTTPNTWQQHPMNTHEHAHHRLHQHHHQRFNVNRSSKLLLQSSDDPLICRGANSVSNDDDHPAEFKTLIDANHHQPTLTTSMKPVPIKPPTETRKNTTSNFCSSLTKQQLKVKVGLMSRSQVKTSSTITPSATPVNTATATTKCRAPKRKKKGAIKLRFHHQALPPEYLSHYEATQGQLLPRTHKGTNDSNVKVSQTAKLPPPKSAHENVRSWLQKIAEVQRTAQEQQQKKKTTVVSTTVTNGNSRQHLADKAALLPTISATNVERLPGNNLMKAVPAAQAITQLQQQQQQPPPQTTTVNNAASVPAKRVIKYTDLPYMGEITLDNSKPRRGRKPKKTDICHLIYKNYGTIFPGTPREVFTARTSADLMLKVKLDRNRALVDQPLNLCMRDQSTELYSVSSEDDEHDEVGTSTPTSNCPTPVATAADVVIDAALAANMKSALCSNHHGKVQQLKQEPNNDLNASLSAADVQLASVSRYYQRLIESGNLLQENATHLFGLPVQTIEKDNQLALKIPIPSGLLLTPKVEKSVSVPEYPEPMSTPSSIKSEHSNVTSVTTSSAVNGTPQQLPPQKRKRSAIFIPPMPAEHTGSSPATEVSICKFKFTGGVKPTLQEKKMLSVDADGNYRYYSGTGDKSMRGYEFFPRESLQQSGLLPGVNCTGAFLNAAGEKISLDLPPPSAELNNELLQIPDSPNSALLLPTSSSPQTSMSPPCSVSPHPASTTPNNGDAFGKNSKHQPQNVLAQSYASVSSTTGGCGRSVGERKKRTRRSSHREKLEKTFKEKGFLIQTQQLESAEGATYCKFRQLKKFTRYLFRNWKDYLPDDLQHANAAAAAAAVAAAALNKAQSTECHNDTATAEPQHATLERILAGHNFEMTGDGIGGNCDTVTSSVGARVNGS